MNRRLSIRSGLVALSIGMGMVMSVWAGSAVTVAASAVLPNASGVSETKTGAPSTEVKTEVKTAVKKTAPESRVTLPVISDAGNLPVTEVSAQSEPILIQSTDAGAKAGLNAVKPSLGDAIVSQQALHVYLDQPASISLYSARGQLVYRLESNRRTEVLPLQGVPTGFLYLTLRAGPYELTKKIVYSGR